MWFASFSFSPRTQLYHRVTMIFGESLRHFRCIAPNFCKNSSRKMTHRLVTHRNVLIHLRLSEEKKNLILKMVGDSMTGIWRLKKFDKKSRSGYATVKWWNILPRYISHEVAYTRLENQPIRMKMELWTNQKPGKSLSNQRQRIWNQSFLILKKMKFLNLELNSNQEPVLSHLGWVISY